MDGVHLPIGYKQTPPHPPRHQIWISPRYSSLLGFSGCALLMLDGKVASSESFGYENYDNKPVSGESLGGSNIDGGDHFSWGYGK